MEDKEVEHEDPIECGVPLAVLNKPAVVTQLAIRGITWREITRGAVPEGVPLPYSVISEFPINQ